MPPSGTITRVAGTGTAGNSGDDGPATEAQLSAPLGVAVTADGGFLIADNGNRVVRKVWPSGTITRVAGTGIRGHGGDDGRATDAQFDYPEGLAVTADGGFLIGDATNHVVRKVWASGTITRVAGTGTVWRSGDDGPATEAQLNAPRGVAVTADGGFLISDGGNRVVRKVWPSGTITRVAGTDTLAYSGDDGPATDAEFTEPGAVAVSADGGFLIADGEDHVVRKVSPLGIITRVAGNGTLGNTGDDGPATAAQLFVPIGVAVTADGGFLIVDRNANVVRKVSPSGTISRVAGTGAGGDGGEDGPATSAQLAFPQGVAVTADGGFLISDDNRVLKVWP